MQLPVNNIKGIREDNNLKKICIYPPIISNNKVSGARGCGLRAPSTAPAPTRQAPTTPRNKTHSRSGGRPQHDLGALPSPSEHAYAAPLPDLEIKCLYVLSNHLTVCFYISVF